MQFKEWLIDEVRMRDMAEHIDDDMAQYLNQFPDGKQAQALLSRYQLLKKAIDENGKIRPDWDDMQTIYLSSGGGWNSLSFHVDTKITKWINKLQKQGIDPVTIPVPTKADASKSISYWRGLTKARLGRRQDFPGEDDYVSGHLQKNPRSTPMIGRDYWKREGLDWPTLKKEIIEEIYGSIKNRLTSLSRPTHTNHLNYSHWNQEEKQVELMHAALQYLEKNHMLTAQQWIDNRKVVRQMIKNYIDSKFQGGLIGRRKVAASGLNIPELLSQGWSHEKIANYIKSGEYKQQPMPLKMAM